MSTSQSSEPHNVLPIDQQSVLVDPFEFFSNDKVNQLRQLEPFSNKNSAYLNELIQKAWNSFSEDEKGLYFEEANYPGPKLELYDDTWVTFDSLKAVAIYLKEMNIIILQDNDFSHKGLIKMLWVKGWMLLREEQRSQYFERSKKVEILCGMKSTRHKVAETVLYEYGKVLTYEDDMADRTFQTELCSHCYNIPISLWTDLSSSKRDEYYDKNYHKTVLEKACKLYCCEAKEKLPEDKVKGEYCLKCEYNSLNDAEKQIYLEKAENFTKTNMKNVRKRFEEEVPITDPRATPRFKMYHNFRWDHNDDSRAFDVYCIKVWPSLENEPGMASRRGFEMNIILLQRWKALSKEEKQPYYDVLPRIKEIESELRFRIFHGSKFYDQDKNGKMTDYFDLSDKERAVYEKKALEARKQVLKDIPDFYDYFSWQKGYYKQDRNYENYEYDVTMKEYPGKPFIVKQKFTEDWFNTSIDPDKGYKEMDAFEQFQRDLCPHKGGLSHAYKWKKWFEVPDSQHNEYYAKYRLIDLQDKACCNYRVAVDPKFDLPYCYECRFESMTEDETKVYFKEARKGLKKDHKHAVEWKLKTVKKEEKDKDSEPKDETMHLWTKHVDSTCWARMKVDPRLSLEFNVFYFYFKKFMPTFSKLAENQNIPYFRVSEKLEQQFWDLPVRERQPYFDAVLRHIELLEKIEPLGDWNWYLRCLESSNESPDSGEANSISYWDMSESEESVCKKNLLQARAQLLQDNPDLPNYFYCKYSPETDSLSGDESDASEVCDELDQNKKAPTAFMCFVHSTRPMMLQNSKFAAKEAPQQRSALRRAWKNLSKEQKAVFYEKEERVLSRVQLKLFYQQFRHLFVDESKI